MIVAETADRFQFVTQPAHADLAGQFADRWGNDAVASPDPDAAMRIAAYAHDAGWQEYDRRPHLADDGTPVDFREMPPGVWIDLYEDGIDAVVDLDRYAGLLVSMHGAGLRNQRYGLSPAWPETPPEYRSFVDEQEDRQARLGDALREAGRLSPTDVDLLGTLHESGVPPAGAESRLWDNYTLLQAWDTLSLSFCTTLTPPSYDEISPVPVGRGRTGTLSVERIGEGSFRVDPYPFDVSPLVVSVPARIVRKGTFDGEDDLLRAYYRAERELKEFTIRQ